MIRSSSKKLHAGYRRAGCFFVVAAALFAGGGVWLSCKGPTPQQVERQFRAALPIGTSRTAAESWLKDRGIRFDVVENNADAAGGWRMPAPEQKGATGRQVSSTVVAKVEPVFVDLFWHGAVSAYLYFDMEGKLIGCGFVPTETAP
jgi:hypothetical protein